MELKTETSAFIHIMAERFGVDVYINGKELTIKGTQEKLLEILK